MKQLTVKNLDSDYTTVTLNKATPLIKEYLRFAENDAFEKPTVDQILSVLKQAKVSHIIQGDPDMIFDEDMLMDVVIGGKCYRINPYSSKPVKGVHKLSWSISPLDEDMFSDKFKPLKVEAKVAMKTHFIEQANHRLQTLAGPKRGGGSKAKRGGLSLGGPPDDEDDYEDEQQFQPKLPTKSGYYEVSDVVNLSGGSKGGAKRGGGKGGKAKANKFASLGITNHDAIAIYFDGKAVDFAITSSNTIITNNETDLTELFSAGASYKKINIADWLPRNVG